MNDTTPDVERKYREMLMAKSNEERFIMGALMFDAARSMALASFPKSISKNEQRRLLYQRFYGKPSPE